MQYMTYRAYNDIIEMTLYLIIELKLPVTKETLAIASTLLYYEGFITTGEYNYLIGLAILSEV